MLDKIIIISWSNYDQRIGDQFDVLYLINNGYVVEYWDVSNITIPGDFQSFQKVTGSPVY